MPPVRPAKHQPIGGFNNFRPGYTLKPNSTANTLTFEINKELKTLLEDRRKVNGTIYINSDNTLTLVETPNLLDEYHSNIGLYINEMNIVLFPPKMIRGSVTTLLHKICRLTLDPTLKRTFLDDPNLTLKEKKKRVEALNLIKTPLMIGNPKDCMSGRSSVARKGLVSTTSHNLRLTLTIDPALHPDEILIPRKIYAELIVMCSSDYMVISRAPSIDSHCIYVCHVKPHDYESSTMVSNGWILEGLHADQDGDELVIYFSKILQNVYGQFPTKLQLASAGELARLSWRFGTGTNTHNMWRFKVCQQHVKYLSLYSPWFERNSRLWKKMVADFPNLSVRERANKILTLRGIDEAGTDRFVDMMGYFIRNFKEKTLTIPELYSPTKVGGRIHDIANFNVKGTLATLHTYEQLFEKGVAKEEQIVYYNKTVSSQKMMGASGGDLFKLLHVCSQSSYYNGNLLSNDRVCATKGGHTAIMISSTANVNAGENLINELLSDTEVTNLKDQYVSFLNFNKN